MELVNEAQRAIAHAATGGFGETRHRRALNTNLATGWRIESAQQMQKRALARSRRADDRDPFAGQDGEVDAKQHRNIERPPTIRLGERMALEHRRGSLIHNAAPQPD